MKQPPQIIKDKFDSACGYGMIPCNALDAMFHKLRDRERRLLLYYACQADGFRPSARRIEDVTKIDAKHLSSVRKKLEETGFIVYDEKRNTIRIMWGALPKGETPPNRWA